MDYSTKEAGSSSTSSSSCLKCEAAVRQEMKAECRGCPSGGAKFIPTTAAAPAASSDPSNSDLYYVWNLFPVPPVSPKPVTSGDVYSPPFKESDFYKMDLVDEDPQEVSSGDPAATIPAPLPSVREGGGQSMTLFSPADATDRPPLFHTTFVHHPFFPYHPTSSSSSRDSEVVAEDPTPRQVVVTENPTTPGRGALLINRDRLPILSKQPTPCYLKSSSSPCIKEDTTSCISSCSISDGDGEPGSISYSFSSSSSSSSSVGLDPSHDDRLQWSTTIVNRPGGRRSSSVGGRNSRYLLTTISNNNNTTTTGGHYYDSSSVSPGGSDENLKIINNTCSLSDHDLSSMCLAAPLLSPNKQCLRYVGRLATTTTIGSLLCLCIVGFWCAYDFEKRPKGRVRNDVLWYPLTFGVASLSFPLTVYGGLILRAGPLLGLYIAQLLLFSVFQMLAWMYDFTQIVVHDRFRKVWQVVLSVVLQVFVFILLAYSGTCAKKLISSPDWRGGGGGGAAGCGPFNEFDVVPPDVDQHHDKHQRRVLQQSTSYNTNRTGHLPSYKILQRWWLRFRGRNQNRRKEHQIVVVDDTSTKETVCQGVKLHQRPWRKTIGQGREELVQVGGVDLRDKDLDGVEGSTNGATWTINPTATNNRDRQGSVPLRTQCNQLSSDDAAGGGDVWWASKDGAMYWEDTDSEDRRAVEDGLSSSSSIGPSISFISGTC